MDNILMDIINYLNELNHYMFTSEELQDFLLDYKIMVLNGEKEIIINLLNEEYLNSKDKKILEFINQVIKM